MVGISKEKLSTIRISMKKSITIIIDYINNTLI